MEARSAERVVRGGDALWLVGISGVLALVLLPFASYVASLPSIRQEWGLTHAQAGAVYSAYLLGFALGSLAVVPLTDRYPTRRVFLVAVWASVGTNLLFPLLARDFWTGVLLRFVAGPALVGVYVPGVRLVAERFAGARRGRAVGLFVSAFYLGGALSLGVTGGLLTWMPWRPAYLLTALMALPALLLAHLLLRDVGARPGGASAHLRLAPLRSLPLVLVFLGYALHAYELYLVRVWLSPFLVEVLEGRGVEPSRAVGLGAGAAGLMLAVGAPSPFLGGLLSDRLGRTLAASLLFGLSGGISFTFGWLAGLPWGVLVAVGFLYGFAVGADSAIYSTAVTELSPPDLLGSAQALHTFAGFMAGVLAPIAGGAVLDTAPEPLRWGLGFGTAGVAGLLAIGGMLLLRALPESARMAGGRR